MKNNTTQLEATVLKHFTRRVKKHRSKLTIQLSNAKVLKRQVTKVGFITRFTVPDIIETLDTMSKRKVFKLYAEHPHTHAGAEFMLWFECGKLKYLEGYVLVGHWPNEEYTFHFHSHNDLLHHQKIEGNLANHQNV